MKTMNLNPEDPRLSSYLLGELSPDEATEVERAVAADPALRVAMEELGETQRILGDSLGGEQHQLHGWQREAVHRAARDAEAAGKLIELPSRRRSWRPVVVLAAAAAVVFLVGWAMWKFPIRGDERIGKQPVAPDWSDPKVEIAMLPMPGPASGEGTGVGAVGGAPSPGLVRAQREALRDDPQGFLERIGSTLHSGPLPPADRLPAQVERKPVDAAKTPIQPLPLIAGEVSYHWLRSAVLDDGRLPPPAAVRVGELVNAFQYRLSPVLEVGEIRLAAECGACPWDEKARLVLITLESAGDDAREIAAAYEANPAAVSSYRLLGFGGGSADVAAPARGLTTVPANHRANLMLQVWPSAAGGDSLGEVTMRVARGESVEDFRLPLDSGAGWEECSADFRHAALTAGAGLWLGRSELDPAPEPQLLGMLAARVALLRSDPDERWAEGLQMILRAAKLAAE